MNAGPTSPQYHNIVLWRNFIHCAFTDNTLIVVKLKYDVWLLS